MTIHEIPNIEHCDIETIGTIGYRIWTHEGWYIRKPNTSDGVDENGNPTKIYQTVIVVWTTEDCTGIEIVAEADLPPNAEICGDTNNDHEVM